VVLGLICALAAAGAYGGATVLQALAAARAERSSGLDPRFLLRLLRSGPYGAGLVLDVAGFALSLAALRQLPVYAVQAVVSANLVVVALLSWPVLHARLTRPDRLAVGAVVLGLVLVAYSAGPQGPVDLSRAGRWGLLAAAVVVALVAAAVARRSTTDGAVLGLLAGLEFGIVAVAGRVVPVTLDLAVLVRDPAVYALLAAGGIAQVLYPTALQRGSVTATSAVVVAAETLAPAAAGAALLGDLPRPGTAPDALAGLVLVLGGTLLLSRRRIAQPA
jgi:drug/metabolite transporter (DMT)-like permease